MKRLFLAAILLIPTLCFPATYTLECPSNKAVLDSWVRSTDVWHSWDNLDTDRRLPPKLYFYVPVMDQYGKSQDPRYAEFLVAQVIGNAIECYYRTARYVVNYELYNPIYYKNPRVGCHGNARCIQVDQ